MAKIIIIDIETAPNIALTWGIYDQNVPKVVQQMYVFGFAYKWQGKKTKSCYIWDFPLYKKEPTNDYEVAKRWQELVSEAEIVVGHNSKSFDDKIMMGRLMIHKIPPPVPFLNVDTKNGVKGVAKFDSNKLDDLGDRFGIGRKIKHEGIDLWWGCMQGDKKAQKTMVKYNIQDVVLTEKLYEYELPYMKSHPATNVIDSKPGACPRCGVGKMHKAMKYRATNTNLYQYYRCQNCSAMAKSRVPEYKQSQERMMYQNAN